MVHTNILHSISTISRDEQIPDLFITSWEIEFLRAETYNRGIGVAANPATAKDAL